MTEESKSYSPGQSGADALLGRFTARALLDLLVDKGILTEDERFSVLEQVRADILEHLGLPADYEPEGADSENTAEF